MVEKFIAVIPARGGSKRIPQKNIYPFGGKPLIAWTIEAAIESGIFRDVIVSTDSEEIADTVKKYGASVPFLRERNNDDFSSVSEAAASAVAQYEDFVGNDFNHVAILQPTSPLRSGAVLREAVDYYCTRKPPALISCAEYLSFTPWWACELDENNQPQPLFPDAQKMRSQDLPQLYCPSGSIVITNKAVLLKNRNVYVPGHVLYPIPWIAAFDIDTIDEMKFLESLV